jgi:hypothetical protein
VAWHYRGVVVRARADVTPSFFAIHSLAIDDFRKTNSTGILPSIVSMNDYYFAFGVNASSELELSVGPIQMGTRYQTFFANEIRGHDRLQRDVTVDPKMRDSQQRFYAWIKSDTPIDWLKVGIHFEQLDREGRVDRVTRNEVERLLMGRLDCEFF